jgi:hypothetical protein
VRHSSIVLSPNGQPASASADKPLRQVAIDYGKGLPVRLVNVHVAARDIEPPATQLQGTSFNRGAYVGISHQVLELNQHVELREAVIRREPIAGRDILGETGGCRSGVVEARR